MSPRHAKIPSTLHGGTALLGTAMMSLLCHCRSTFSCSPGLTSSGVLRSATPAAASRASAQRSAAATAAAAASFVSFARARTVPGGIPGWILAPTHMTLSSLPRQRSVEDVRWRGTANLNGAETSARSRRRRKTSLGMVSDRPFRAPQIEAPEKVDFRSLGLLDELVDAMDEFGFESPSKIQQKAISQLLSGGNVVVAASTGSGKTLAYLMPVIQHLKAQEAQASVHDGEPVRRMQRPRAIVLVPTRELAVQVLEVAKRLARTCKISSCGIIGGEDYGKQKQRLASTVDIVVATPGRLLKHQEQGSFFLSKVTHVVVDEMDTMFTQGFAPDIEKLTRPMLANPERRESTQFVFVTATLTRAVRKLLDEGRYPKVRMLETRDVHHTLPTLNHVMIDIKGRDKMSNLVDVTRQHHKDFKRTLVFCNTVKSCQAAEFGLREADLPTLAYHGDVPSDERAQNLERFKAGEVEYLVCTDIAARGLDMPDVDHVVMFDFPLNPIDYLHRSGRTARMGAKGRVTSLLAKRDLVLAAAIEQAVQAGLPLDELSSRRTDYAVGAKLAPLFGRKGKVTRRGNHHALKDTMNTRARGYVAKNGEKVGQRRKGDKLQLVGAGSRRTSPGRSGPAGRTGGPGRARKYN